MLCGLRVHEIREYLDLLCHGEMSGKISGGLAGMPGCDRNPGPLNFIIIGPSVDKFEKITQLISKTSLFKRLQVTEMKIKSLERKHFIIVSQGRCG